MIRLRFAGLALLCAVISLISVMAAAAPATAAASSVVRTVTGVQCQGSFGCLVPSDADIAVGYSEVIETTNCMVTAFDKTTGAVRWNVSQQALFGLDQTTTGCADSRVIFIPWRGVFALSYWEFTGPTTPLRFAVSTGNNPTQSPQDWHEYATPSGFFDQTKIEATGTNLIVSGNSNLGVEQYLVYDLGQILNGQPNPAESTVNDTVDLTVATVNNSQPPNNNAYFVSAGASGINLSTITGTPTQHTVALSHQTFGSPAIGNTTEPAVNGGFLGGHDLDNRVLSAAFEQQFSNGHFVIEFSGNTECDTQAALCAYDVKLDLNTTPATIIKNVQLGGTPGQSYSYGSVALDGQGNAYLAYSKSDPNNTPDAAVLATDTAGTMLFNTTTRAHTAGTTACGGGTCDERWGDYFGGAQDPSNPNIVWTVAQWQQSSGGLGWGTEISEEQSFGVIAP